MTEKRRQEIQKLVDKVITETKPEKRTLLEIIGPITRVVTVEPLKTISKINADVG